MNDKYKIINDNGEGVYEIECEKSNIHYYVNEPKKTVAAVMCGAGTEFRCEIDRLIDRTFGFVWDCSAFYNYGFKYIKSTYRGKAHCIKNDEFNLETGMRIAREHMLANYYVDRAIAFAAVSERIGQFLNEIDYRTDLAFQRAEKFIDISNEHYENAHSVKD